MSEKREKEVENVFEEITDKCIKGKGPQEDEIMDGWRIDKWVDVQ